MDVLQRGLEVMDSTAMALCMDNGLPDHRLRHGDSPEISAASIWGEAIGTYVGRRASIAP